MDGREVYRKTLKVVRLLVMGLLLAYFPVVMFFVRKEQKAVVCRAIKTNVHNDGQNVLISDRALEHIVRLSFPEAIGTPLAELDFNEIEREIEKSDVVKRCEAYPTIDGSLHVEIDQRMPIMRVFTSDGSYYMDAEGYKIPSTRDMLSQIVIVNGAVNNMMDQNQLIRLCLYIHSDSFWRAMIEQIYVTKEQEFLLYPRVGNHTIEFGGIDRLEQKFADLKTLYSKGWAKDEWNIYSRVCLKYHGQIVCTKR